MSKMTYYANRALRFIRSRAGAVTLLALICFISAFCFAPYMKPGAANNDSKYYFSKNTEAREAVDESGVALAGSKATVIYVYPHSDSDAQSSKAEGSLHVELCVAGQSAGYMTDKLTVGKFLKENKIELGENDIVTPSVDSEIYDYIKINIDRITFEDVVSNEIITCKTVKVEDDSLKAGETVIVSAGSDGIKTIVTRTTYKNGIKDSTAVISEEVTTPAVNRIVNVGTKKTASSKKDDSVKTFIDSAGREVAYSQVIKGTGSAYTAPAGSTSVTGRLLSVGVVAVDPEKIPYGTRLYITSADGKFVYGYALAADTNTVVESGSAVVGLYYDSESQCRVFGNRDVNIYVVEG